MNQVNEGMREGSASQPQILLMEDESSVAQGLQMIHREAGYGVDLAVTGQSALDTLNHKDFDLLVADLRLPDMDGMEVIKRVKDERPETGVIVITGYANIPSAVEAMKTGVADYLPKPFTDDEFKAAVEEALKEKREVSPRDGFRPFDSEDENLIQKKDVIQVLKRASEDDDLMGQSIDTASKFLKAYQLSGEANGSLVFKENEEIGRVCFFRDLREIRRLEQPFADQTRLLQQHKMISMGRLAASVVHEINNPLAGILNYLRLMIKIIGRESLSQKHLEKFKRYLTLVESEISRCSEIVSNLLAFSRKSKLEFSEVNIHELLEKCITLSQHKLDLQNIRIKTELEEKIPAVWGDFNQIQQCLINLIFNAIDAMPDGGTLIIGCTYNLNKGKLEIRVEDNGSGIPEQDLPHIFEPFYTTKTEGNGLGLGLATVFDIIERHKGTIHVESEPGKGTIFTIKLPGGKKGFDSSRQE